MFLPLSHFSSLILPKGNLTTLGGGVNGIKIAANGWIFLFLSRQSLGWFEARRRRCLCDLVTSRRVRRKLKPGEGFHRQLGVSAAGAFTHTRPNTCTHAHTHTSTYARAAQRQCHIQWALSLCGLSIRITLAHRDFFFLCVVERLDLLSFIYTVSFRVAAAPKRPQPSVAKKRECVLREVAASFVLCCSFSLWCTLWK